MALIANTWGCAPRFAIPMCEKNLSINAAYFHIQWASGSLNR